MPHQSHAYLKSPRLLVGALIVALVALSVQVVVPRLAPRAVASSGTLLCVGFTDCQDAGMSNSAYHQHWQTMYWRMYSGRNCVNYAAYRMVAAGMPNSRPWSGSGNATNWGYAMSSITDTTPRQGAVAWWKSNAPGAGSLGHVAYVEKVVSSSDIIISESNWGSDFDWREVTKSSGWPTGFIHFVDKTIQNQTLPQVIGGDPAVGRTLSVTTGRWLPASSFTYQWLINGTPRAGQTAQTYTPGAFALGKKISVQVTAHASGYDPSTVVVQRPGTTVPGTIVTRTMPTITGTPIVGQSLQLVGERFQPGISSSSGGSEVVQWYADGSPIAGATKRILPLTQSMAGSVITASITASLAAYNDLTVTAAPTTEVLDPLIAQDDQGSISGDATRLAHLTVNPGTFTPATGVKLAYQWMRDGQPVANATRATYIASKLDVGHLLSVRVTASAQDYRDLVTTYRVPTRITVAPTLKVRPTGGQLSAHVKVWVVAPGVPAQSVGGRLTVKVGTHQLSAKVVDGYAVFDFTTLGVGKRGVTVTYGGDSPVLAATATTSVVVKAKPKKKAAKSSGKSSAKSSGTTATKTGARTSGKTATKK